MLRQQRLIAAALFSLCLLRCGSAWCAAAPATLHWQTNLEDAKRIAAQSNRLVLVHFWSPSCKACVELDNKVFSQPQVQQFIDARFIPIKINADDAPTTTKRYGIVQLPTDLILTPGAQIVGRMACPLAADAYMQQLLIASTAPAPSVMGNPGYAANVNAPAAPPQAAALNTAPVASTAAASPPPAVGYSGQWTAKNPMPPSSKRTPIIAIRNFSSAIPRPPLRRRRRRLVLMQLLHRRAIMPRQRFHHPTRIGPVRICR